MSYPQQPAWVEQPWAEQDGDPAYFDPGYDGPGYDEPVYERPGYGEPVYDEPGYDEPAYGREAYRPDEYYPDPGDGFPGQPAPDPYPDTVAGGYARTGAGPDSPGFPPPMARPSGRRYRGERRQRRPGTRLQRMAGLLVAAASLTGVVLLAPSILTAAKNRPFTGVVSRSSLASLNFGVPGRVGKIAVRPGQVVRKGEVLARETAPAGLGPVRADQAAITADKADLAALTAAAAPPASVAVARDQLAKDRARQAADRAAMVIRAPQPGTVLAVFGHPGDLVTPAGLRTGAAAAHLGGLLASLRAGGLGPPVLALRTGGDVLVKLTIPARSAARARAGGTVTVTIPADRLTRVSGTITTLAPKAGGQVRVVVRVGRTSVTPLVGMTAEVLLG